MTTIQLKRMHGTFLHLIVDGQRVGIVRQGAGRQSLYTVKAFGIEFSALSQADLKGRISDYLDGQRSLQTL